MQARPLTGLPVSAWAADRIRDGVTLVVLAALGPVLACLGAAAYGGPAFNDFNVYWLAGGLVDRGLSPYDNAALAALAEEEGRRFILGGGYSYPPPFAVAMVPLSRLPFDVALGLFLAASIALFALSIAAGLLWMTHQARRWGMVGPTPGRRQAAALLAGCFPPVLGSVGTGQANLLVVAALVPGVALLLARNGARNGVGGVLAGVATVIKLVPGVAAVPLLLARRLLATGLLLAGVAVTLLATGVLAPWAMEGSSSLTGLFDPDPYFTNVSLNGFVSRLVLSTGRTTAIAPGAFDAGTVMSAVTGAFALATLVVLWRGRSRMRDDRGLALAIGFALLAGVIGAPKNSFWNAALTLVPAGLLLVVEAPALGAARIAHLDRLDRRLFVVFVAGIAFQPVAWLAPAPFSPGLPASVQVLAGSTATFGLLALWWLFARRLSRRAVPADRTGPSDHSPVPRLAGPAPSRPEGGTLS